jgi:hypothetical protein
VVIPVFITKENLNFILGERIAGAAIHYLEIIYQTMETLLGAENAEGFTSGVLGMD